MPAAILASALIACLNPTAVDGDNVRCDGVNMRIIGVNAREADGSCRGSAPCPAMSGADAREVLQRLVRGGLQYRVEYFDTYDRPVITGRLADGRDLSCALIAVDAAARWAAYWPAEKRC